MTADGGDATTTGGGKGIEGAALEVNGGVITASGGTGTSDGKGVNSTTITLATGINFYTADAMPVTTAGNIITSPYSTIKRYVAISKPAE